MRFNLIIFVNLAAIASTETPRPVSLLTKLLSQLEECPSFVERLKKFRSCDVPSTLNATYLEDALPYICLITLNMMIEVCRESSSLSRHVFKPQENATVCPFNYEAKKKNLDIDVNAAARYFRNKKNCEAVCNYNKKTEDDCAVMAMLKEEVMRLYQNGEKTAKLTSSRLHQPSLQQDISLNITKPSYYSERQKEEDGHALLLGMKAGEPVINCDETTSECETKKDEEKTNSRKVDPGQKQETGQINRETNNNKIINSGGGGGGGDAMASEKEILKKVNTNSDSTIHNKNIDDNIHEDPTNNNDNKNKNKEMKEVKSGVIAGKMDLPEGGMPFIKGENDQSLMSSTSFSKKDFTYGSTIKVSADEADEDDDNNEEIIENQQQQDVVPGREYEFRKVPNPKELYNGDGLFQAEDSHFSAYFLMTISIIIIGYVIYHNKNKIVAYALEGRRGRNGRRRPTSASYRKLDCNLEEAIASNPSHASVTNVVY